MSFDHDPAPNPTLDLVSEAVLARLDGPMDKVRGLPNTCFASQAFFELERETLFPRSWVFASAASDLPDVGDVWIYITEQDLDVTRWMQEGRRGAYDGGRFAPYWDRGTVHFHEMVAHAVRGDGPFAPAA